MLKGEIMKMYVARIRLEDGIVEMPMTRYYSQAKEDLRTLNARYSEDITIGRAFIVEL